MFDWLRRKKDETWKQRFNDAVERAQKEENERNERRNAENKLREEAGAYWKLAYAHYAGIGCGTTCGNVVYGKSPLDRFCEKCGTCAGTWRVGRVKWSKYQMDYGYGYWIKKDKRIGDFEDMSGGWK